MDQTEKFTSLESQQFLSGIGRVETHDDEGSNDFSEVRPARLFRNIDRGGKVQRVKLGNTVAEATIALAAELATVAAPARPMIRAF